jgi:hypothetical protein
MDLPALSHIPSPYPSTIPRHTNGPEGPFVLSASDDPFSRYALRVFHARFHLLEVLAFLDRRTVLVHDAHGVVVSGHCSR